MEGFYPQPRRYSASGYFSPVEFEQQASFVESGVHYIVTPWEVRGSLSVSMADEQLDPVLDARRTHLLSCMVLTASVGLGTPLRRSGS